MTKLNRGIMAAVLGLALHGEGGGALALSVDTGAGRQLALTLCAGCHMNPGQGEKSGPAGIPSFQAVADRPGQSLENVVTWLRSAPPMMPKHHLSNDEMFALAQFIMSLRHESK